MANRFGRNQKRKMQALLERSQEAAIHAQSLASNALDRWAGSQEKLAQALRDQLEKGKIPLEVEHFLNPEMRTIVMHAIFDERRANLHYQHAITPNELRIQRDSEERERLGQYLGRAIADRLADACAGKAQSTSRAA